MILGRGTAQTDEAIIAEYYQFLRHTCSVTSAIVLQRFYDAPGLMKRRIGKPILQWTDQELFALYRDRQKASRQPYSAFLAFLLFRGYYRASLCLLEALPLNLARQHRRALAPHLQRLKQAQEKLQYASCMVGTELNLLICLLSVVGKPLTELTRADFDRFWADYQTWYRKAERCDKGRPNPRLFRLERYLVHWGLIPPRHVIFRHEEHFARLCHAPIRNAILTHMEWCDAKYTPSTIHSRRAGLLSFFLWFQERSPDCSRLSQVTRAVALEYARHLNSKVDEGIYSPKYRTDLYRHVRLFFDFVIEERLKASPHRNPFGRSDMPQDPDPVPRYLPDDQLRTVLEYCHNGASLKERTVVSTLLHTGIRAGEFAALQNSNIIQVQGKWKVHIREGKGLKDRLIPLTTPCLSMLQEWKEHGWERVTDYLFTHHGRPWRDGANVCAIVRELGHKLGVESLTPHRFRHTFAVALLNYGIRESALQKLMGHATLNMTLEYARILDQTVEQAFNKAVEQMQVGPLSWVPSFFAPEDYSLFTAGDSVNWIRLAHGYCRRNPKLHCESDVKCFLCDRFCALPADLPRLQEMHERFKLLGMQVKADVVASQIRRLEGQADKSGADFTTPQPEPTSNPIDIISI